jgi:WD40 repeat protein
VTQLPNTRNSSVVVGLLFLLLAGSPTHAADPEAFELPPVALLPQVNEQIVAVAFSPDGQRLVTAGAWHDMPGQLTIWDVAARKALVRLRGTGSIRTVAYSPDGTTIATGEFGGAIRLRDASTGQERAVLNGHTSGVNKLAFSQDGASLASAGLDRVVRVWDVKDRRERLALQGHTDMVLGVAFFSHGQALVSCGKDRTPLVWDLRTGKQK